MKKLIFFFFLPCIFIFNNPCYSQLGKLKDLKKKAENATEKVGVSTNDKNDSEGSYTSSSESSSSDSNILPVMQKEEKLENEPDVEVDYAGYVKFKSALAKKLLAGKTEILAGINSRNYYNYAYDMQYEKTCTILKERGIKDAKEDHYNQVLNLREQYPEIIETNLKPYIDEKIDEVYQGYANQSFETIANLKSVTLLADAILLIEPENETAQKLKEKVNRTWKTIEWEHRINPFTTPFHTRNAGKILFSDQPIVYGSEDPDQFKTEFTANDNIYGMVYMAGTVYEGPAYGTAIYRIDADNGASTMLIKFLHNEEEIDYTYYPIDIIPDPDHAIHSLDPVEWADKLSKLSPGTHHLKITYDDMAEGVLNLDWSDVNSDELKSNAKLAAENAGKNYASGKQLPDAFRQPSGKYKDPDLQEANLKKLMLNKWSNCQEIVKLVIEQNTDDDYLVYDTDAGLPSYKVTRADCHAVYKGKDGWCYYVKDISFSKNYQGGGIWGPAFIDFERAHIKIDCENVK
ncbi:MAG: hypothetical protein JXB24_08545 [Bacteroidales bacterium]|nr:hypothetical protein [Bacteroidales bacterium]